MSKLTTYILSFATLSLFLGGEQEVGGILLRPFDALLALALFAWLYQTLKTGRTGIKKADLSSPITLCMAFLCVYVPLNALLLSSAAVAAKEGLQYAEFLLYLLVMVSVTRTAENRRLFLKVLFYGLSAAAVVTAVYHISQGIVIRYKELGDTKYAFGVASFFALCLYVSQRRRADKTQLLWLGVMLLLMLLSGERKGWAAFAGASAAMLFAMLASGFRRRSQWASLLLKGAPFAFMVLVCGMLIYVGSSQARIYVTSQLASFEKAVALTSVSGSNYMAAETGSDRVRLFLMDYSIEMFTKNPVFGIGPDQFKNHLQWAIPNENFLVGPHNQYLSYAVETGILGLFAFVGLWLSSIGRAYRAVRAARANQFVPSLLIFGLAVYGAVLSAFIAGGAVTMAFLIFPAALALGLKAT